MLTVKKLIITSLCGLQFYGLCANAASGLVDNPQLIVLAKTADKPSLPIQMSPFDSAQGAISVSGRSAYAQTQHQVANQSQTVIVLASKTTTGLGFVVSEHTPNTGTTTSSYDAVGNLKQSTDAVGDVTEFTYTSFGAQDTVTSTDPQGNKELVKYTYNTAASGNSIANGTGFGSAASGSKSPYQLLSVSNENASYTYSYYNNGALSSEAETNSSGALLNKLSFNYDSNGVLLNQIEDHGKGNPLTTTYHYAQGHLLEADMTIAGKTYTVSYSYGEDQALHQINKVNGAMTVDFNYNPDGSIADLSNTASVAGNQTITRDYRYGYNKLGHLSQKSWVSNEKQGFASNELYEYTGFNQLQNYSCASNAAGSVTGAVNACPKDQFGNQLSSESLSFDNSINNLTEIKQGFSNGQTNTITYHYDDSQAPDQLTTVTNSDLTAGNVNLQYNNNGSVTQLNNTVISYNANNQVATVGTSTDQSIPCQLAANLCQINGVISYAYDPLGKQIQSTHNGATESYHYNGETLSSDSDSNNNDYYYAEGGGIKVTDVNGSTTVSYEANFTDGHNLTGTFNTDTKVIESLKVYTPYGITTDLYQDQKANGEATPLLANHNRMNYNLMATDNSTGWQFLGNGTRSYNPYLRHFMQYDTESPWGKGGINGFAYTDNNPIEMYDPNGHSFMSNWNDDEIDDYIIAVVPLIGGIYIGGKGTILEFCGYNDIARILGGIAGAITEGVITRQMLLEDHMDMTKIGNLKSKVSNNDFKIYVYREGYHYRIAYTNEDCGFFTIDYSKRLPKDVLKDFSEIEGDENGIQNLKLKMFKNNNNALYIKLKNSNQGVLITKHLKNFTKPSNAYEFNIVNQGNDLYSDIDLHSNIAKTLLNNSKKRSLFTFPCKKFTLELAKNLLSAEIATEREVDLGAVLQNHRLNFRELE